MKKLAAACGIALLFAVMSSCKNPAGPPSDPAATSYISYSLNGNGTQTTYYSGVVSGSPAITMSVPDVAFASIPTPQGSSTPNLYLYASKNNAYFEASSTDFICISILADGTSAKPAGDFLASDGTGANLTLGLGVTTYFGDGPNSQVDLHIDQAIDNSTSVGKTITGTFSGTISDGTTTATISGSFRLIYQTSILLIV